MRRWVLNTQLRSDQLAIMRQLGHTIFDPTKSSTFVPMIGSKFNVHYGDHTYAKGIVGTDHVDIGGRTVSTQAFGLTTELSQQFFDQHADGLLGLAFSKLNQIRPKAQKTFFDNIIPDLPAPVFTANLKHGVEGGYEFGTIDTTQFRGNLTTIPIDPSRGLWQFESRSFAVGDTKAQTLQGGSGVAIADTGTSLLLVDPGMAEAYYSQVQESSWDQDLQAYIFPCSAPLPDLSVALGSSYMARISGSLLNYGPLGKRQCTGLTRECCCLSPGA